MRSRLPTSSPLNAFAADPPAYLPPPPGSTVVDDARFHLTVSPDGSRAKVCRLHTVDVFDEIVAQAPSARIVWTTGPHFDDALRERGCRDQDPPLTSYITALAIDREPPAVDGVEVRRIESDEEHRLGIEVFERGWGTQRPQARLDGEWLAYVDGEPVAWAGALACEHGLFLTGGVTLPEARGRGAYRALVRARWDDAVRRGTPGLVVHAEEPSRRVLERIGFTHVRDVVELVSGPHRLDA